MPRANRHSVTAQVSRDGVCHVCQEFCRSLPISSACSFLFTVVGVLVGISAKKQVDTALGSMGPKAESTETLTSLLVLTFSLALFVNLAALVLGFLAAGRTRELVFGVRSETHPTLLR